MSKEKEAAPKDVRSAKFGAFKGVFTPSILTILGVIMYLRFGWVVGHGGLLGSILVVVLAHLISLTTGMSIVSIATNRQVKAGGDYYMISRALGMPIGGAIGLSLFVALALSMSLYLIGFAESFLDAFGFENTINMRRLIGAIAAVGLTSITFFSTSLALKIQYLVLAAILLSLVSLFAGTSPAPPGEGIQLWFTGDSESFEVLFAVFFPAVTGFTAGVAMSGDLKNPRRAIPRGTMGAIIFGLIVYLAIPVFLCLKVDPALLREDKMVWMKVALVPQLVVAGVFAATLSSALGSVLGAPRYLQALANDGVVPRFLGNGYGTLNEPRVATVATFIIAIGGVLVGELDLIARVITMFFLTSYGFLCLASGVQAWSGISSFRPDFKTPSWVSFTGAAICLGVMFKLDMAAMFGASVIMALVYLGLKRKRFTVAPGDSWRGFWAAVVQAGLMRLQRRGVDSKNWRPNVLVFGGPPSERTHLTELARWIVGERGLATYVYVMKGAGAKVRTHAGQMEPVIREEVRRRFPGMLTRVCTASDIYDGMGSVARYHGLVGMTPNTVLMGWTSTAGNAGRYGELLEEFMSQDKNLFLLRLGEGGFKERKRLDIWWRGMERNGALMLLSAFLLTSSDGWDHAQVYVNTVVSPGLEEAAAREGIEKILKASRVRAQAKIIVKDENDNRTIKEIIGDVSAGADLVMMGLRPLEVGEGGSIVENSSELIEGLGSTLLVRASTRFDGAAVLFEKDES